MGLCVSYGVGQYAAGQASEAHTIATDRPYKRDGSKRPLLWLHSAGGNDQEAVIALNNSIPLLREVVKVGPVISFDGAAGNPAQHWGNDFAQARTGDAKAYLQGTWGAKAGKALVLGISMGGLLALNWARLNPTLVAAVALLYPAVNLQWIHDNGAAASTEAAYGGTLAAFNAAVAAHDPHQHAADYVGLGIPFKAWYASDDTTVSTAEQEAFFTAAAIPKVNLGAVGHANMGVVPITSVRDFLLANVG